MTRPSLSAGAAGRSADAEGGEREDASGPVVELTGVSVRYPAAEHPVVAGIRLDLARGGSVVVLGPSGSGKSTILHVISGVVPHTYDAEVSGTAVVAGRPVAETSVVELSRTVGALSQDPSSQLCLPSVDDELALPLENRAVEPALIGGRILDALEVVGAGSLRERDTSALSGGESQRVALAATMIAEPEVLLLDEPTSMLDAGGVEAVRAAVDAATRRYRPAVVLVEHRLDEFAGEAGVAGLPREAIVLGRDGRMLASGPTEQVLRTHAAVLRDEGCWLPLDAELYALGGRAGGLDDAGNRRMLAAAAAGGHPASATVGDVVLSVDALAAGTDAAVVSDVSFDLRAGEVVALLGANGAGKSTLLRTLAGLLRPVRGTVTGERAGMVFQNPEHQFVAGTVEAEVAHGLPRGSGPLIERVLSEHRLLHLRTRSPWRLSGGEKRRLSLAAMLVHDRRVLLADEPSYGLDRHDALAASDALRQAAGTGAGVVVASHDLRVIAGIADRILVIEDGRLREGDTDAAAVLRDVLALARAGIRVPPLVRFFAERSADAASLRASLLAFEGLGAAR